MNHPPGRSPREALREATLAVAILRTLTGIFCGLLCVVKMKLLIKVVTVLPRPASTVHAVPGVRDHAAGFKDGCKAHSKRIDLETHKSASTFAVSIGRLAHGRQQAAS